MDFVPIWCVFPLTMAVVVLAIEVGFRLGRRRVTRSGEDRQSVGQVVAATLALLAFLLAFTFGMAASRFEARRAMVIEEANAIGTTYLRAAMLPEPHRSEVRTLLSEYTDVRLGAVEPGKLEQSVRRSQELQGQLWRHATAVGEQQPQSEVVGLFLESLNQVIDLHTTRLMLGARNRIPGIIWLSLYFVTAVGMAVMGYHAGLAGSGRSLAVLALVLAFSAVMTMIADLDHPQEGMLRVSQQAIVDLRGSFDATRP